MQSRDNKIEKFVKDSYVKFVMRYDLYGKDEQWIADLYKDFMLTEARKPIDNE